ncbi:MAG: hypothetical protein U9Q21_03315, partial [Candidatus Auribacterota bacterium]|nr:hypothetical protein [Candidatus Auribacterota bacterium]
MKHILTIFLITFQLIVPEALCISNLDKLKADINKPTKKISDKGAIYIKSMGKQTNFTNVVWSSDTGMAPRDVRAMKVNFKVNVKDWVDCSPSRAVFIDNIGRISAVRKMSFYPGKTIPHTEGLKCKGKHSFTAYFFYNDKVRFKKVVFFLGNPSTYVVGTYPKGFKPDEEMIKSAREAAG